MSKTLNELRDEAHRIAVEHGFKDASIGEDCALMASEISELLEDHRAGEEPTKVWYEEKLQIEAFGETHTIVRRHATMYGPGGFANPPRKPCGIPSELADLIIRALHFAGKHGIDLEQAVEEKMLYNMSRPFKHGGKKL